jgi:hypothetical protein
MGEALPYLEAFHSISNFVLTFVQCKPFGMTWKITRANIEFQWFLDSCGKHYNSSSCNMVSNECL